MTFWAATGVAEMSSDAATKAARFGTMEANLSRFMARTLPAKRALRLIAFHCINVTVM
jgi:hypothetical protein